MAKTRLKESLLHKQAFELYYKMGANRSAEKVAAVLGKNKATVQEWSQAFKWTARVNERDVRVADILAAESLHDIVLTKKKLLQAIDHVLDRHIVMHPDGVTVRNVDGLNVVDMADFEKLVKMQLLLSGEATERGEHKVAGLEEVSDEVLRTMAGRGAKPK